MNYYNFHNDELAHYGIKGQRWGVRRYQNKDGSLTDAGKKRLVKTLTKEYKRNYDSAQPYKTSKAYDEMLSDVVEKHITKADVKRIMSAKESFVSAANKAIEAEDTLDALARDYGSKWAEKELRENPDSYDTPRSKEKLYEYAWVEIGYDKARQARPDLEKVVIESDKQYKSYMEECKKVSDTILGEYGNKTLYQDRYNTRTIRDTVGDILSSKDLEKIKL